jgi:branched-chain amino acid transport system permease protein
VAVLDARPVRWFTAVSLALLLLLPPFLSSYVLTLLTQVLIFATLAMSVDLLLGFTGLPSLGQAAYFGVSAYTVAVMTTKHSTGFWETAALGFVLAICLAALFGLMAIHAAGTYFLMITLALGQVLWGLAYRWVSMTGGDNGLAGVPRPNVGMPVEDPTRFFYFTLVVFLVSAVLLYLVVESPFGYSLMGIRENEARMRILGYHTWLHKYLAFIIAGAFSGVSGILWAYYNGFVSPQDVSLVTNMESLLMVALGGPGTLFGSTVGALVIVFLRNFVSAYTKRWLLILGGMYIFTIMYASKGVLGALRDWGKRRTTVSRRLVLASDDKGSAGT